MNFESSREIERKRLEKKQVREHLLNEAKRKYEFEEHKIAAAKARGEDQWMLPELSQQIDERSKKVKKKTKKLKKEKKSKSEKKSKKKKKSSHSSSDSEASSDDQWVEKGKNVETPVAMDTNNAATHTDKPVKGPVLQRDDWMTLDAVSIPTVSRQELREKIKQDKLQYADEKGQKELNIDEAGTHEKELNPYWKGGAGSGLPEKVKAAIAVPKHSLAFLKKAYTRCEQEAEERGESLEDVVSQRYGSLEQLETMIMEAERAEELVKAPAGDREREGPQARHDDRRKGYLDRHGRRYARSRSDSRDRGRRGRRSRSRSRSRDRRRRSRSRDRERRRSRSRDRERRRSRSRERRSRRRRSSSSSRSRSGGRQTSGPTKSGRRFLKPGDADDQQSSLEKSRRGFLKPDETSEVSRGSAEVKAASQPSWRKPGHQPSAQKSRVEPAPRKVCRSPSASSDSSSEQGADDSDSMSEPEAPAPAVPLTDDEMNALGAKLLRAELMGNDDMVKEIKNKMEAARQLRNSGVAPPVKDDKEKVVMLSSADKFGNVRPVQTPREAGRGGKRRRAKKVETHDKKGERERYFADDDRFNIKDMVQAEKMTSAEDHHMTFSKMAAKVTEKIDDDNQIDDAMINRARLEHDPDKMAAMQRQQAHADSKKLAQTLEDCQHCLENMTKHLIIAVHKNTYLCVPAQRSLNEGHCKIVPIHHCISSTSCDEDVWNEVQEFRRALVQMFTDNDDQDCVFMECCKNLRKHPHMVIECIPIERELGDLAPIYFKKAIDESEKEWAQNKKLVDLSKKDIRHSVPKGFPYFAIDFGLQGGYAHVIEDERNFPAYFGKEVLGGMMDVDSGLWRKPKKEAFEQQRKKVVEFAKMFKPYDFTRRMAHSDSD